ncbi:hypothetical protein K438DRAFT_1966979 [Mycena galopus ATCC 62051]|nr:hypothetical protein K438DRAFT_1966979 [Mycena galopus ATCC 62051]
MGSARPVARRCYFAHLSRETVTLILVFALALEDLPARRRILMAVCQQWREIVHSDPLCNRFVDFSCIYWTGNVTDILLLRNLGRTCWAVVNRFPHTFDLRVAVILTARGWDSCRFFMAALWEELAALCVDIAPRTKSLSIRGSSQVLELLFNKNRAQFDLSVHVDGNPCDVLLRCPALRAPRLYRFSSSYLAPHLIDFLPARALTHLDLFSMTVPNFQDTSLDFFLQLLLSFPLLQRLHVALDDIHDQASVSVSAPFLRVLDISSSCPPMDSGLHTNWRNSSLWGHFVAPSLEALSVPQRWFTMGAFQDLSSVLDLWRTYGCEGTKPSGLTQTFKFVPLVARRRGPFILTSLTYKVLSYAHSCILAASLTTNFGPLIFGPADHRGSRLLSLWVYLYCLRGLPVFLLLEYVVQISSEYLVRLESLKSVHVELHYFAFSTDLIHTLNLRNCVLLGVLGLESLVLRAFWRSWLLFPISPPSPARDSAGSLPLLSSPYWPLPILASYMATSVLVCALPAKLWLPILAMVGSSTRMRDVCRTWRWLLDRVPIDSLPNELLVRIFDMLIAAPPHDRKTLHLVSPTWKLLVDTFAACDRLVHFYYIDHCADHCFEEFHRMVRRCSRAVERARCALLDLRITIHVVSGWNPAAFVVKGILRKLDTLCSAVASRTRSLDVASRGLIMVPIFDHVWPRLTDLALRVSDDPSPVICPAMFTSPLTHFSTSFVTRSILSALLHCNLLTSLELFTDCNVHPNEATLQIFLFVLSTFPLLERLRTVLDDVLLEPPPGSTPLRHASLRELYFSSARPSSDSAGWNPEWIVNTVWAYFEAPSLAELAVPQRWFVMGAFTELSEFFARSGCHPRLIQFVGCPTHLMEDWEFRHAAVWTETVIQVRRLAGSVWGARTDWTRTSGWAAGWSAASPASRGLTILQLCASPLSAVPATFSCIYILPSTLRPPPSALRPPPSALRPPPSALRPPPSALHPPPSALRHPPSALRPPPPYLCYLRPGILPPFRV